MGQTYFCIISQNFYVNMSFSGPVVLEKIFKSVSLYKHLLKVSPFVAIPDPGAMILTNLLFYYIRKLSCKFELFWPSGSFPPLWLHLTPRGQQF
jgi:hypothetical protein